MDSKTNWRSKNLRIMMIQENGWLLQIYPNFHDEHPMQLLGLHALAKIQVVNTRAK